MTINIRMMTFKVTDWNVEHRPLVPITKYLNPTMNEDTHPPSTAHQATYPQKKKLDKVLIVLKSPPESGI